MTDELVIYLDYVGKKYYDKKETACYGIFIGDIKDNPDIIYPSLEEAVNWIINNYGIESSVEFSEGAALIFKIVNGIPFDKDIS